MITQTAGFCLLDENPPAILRLVDLEKLRSIWFELKLARKCIRTKQQSKTDHALVHGATGFALQHLEKAMRMIEELGRDERRKRIRRA